MGEKRTIKNLFMDSAVWDSFSFRDNDIVIASYGKSGTTWLQQIIGQMIFGGDENVDIAKISPWLERRGPKQDLNLIAVREQTHRRFIKTHLPADALPIDPNAKYIYIARDPRDVAWSFYNHHAKANDNFYDVTNLAANDHTPPIEKPTDDVSQYFNDWIANNGEPWWPYWENIRSWWELRDKPNILMLHYNDLKDDPAAEVAKIATLLGIELDETALATILEHSSFAYMKEHADRLAPAGGALWEGGGTTFFHKGTNGRWKDALNDNDIKEYQKKLNEELTPNCADWLTHTPHP